MTTDEDSALSLVRKHLRQIDPPPGAKARASLQLEQRIRGRARTFRPVWALGLTGALVAGASMAAANRGGWFRSEPDRAPASQVAAPVARPTHAKEPRPRQDTPAVPVPPREEAEPASKPEQKRSAARPLHPATATHESSPDSSLSKQVAELRTAMSYAERDDARALAELRAFKRRWKNSPLNHEADIEIVAALQRLGRDTESKAAAKDFVLAHPDSAKAAEMKAIAEDSKSP